MNDFYDAVNALVNGILNYKVTRKEAAARINALKKEYGEDSFPEINFQKEPRPWNVEYFQKLKMMNITGACSEDFILHMAEVAEDIIWKRRIAIIVIAVIAIVILVVLFL